MLCDSARHAQLRGLVCVRLLSRKGSWLVVQGMREVGSLSNGSLEFRYIRLIREKVALCLLSRKIPSVHTRHAFALWKRTLTPSAGPIEDIVSAHPTR